MNPVDPRLYLVVGPDDCRQRPLAELVRAAVAGGVTLVQLRAKHASSREWLTLTATLRQALTTSGVPLLINDRVDIALAGGADGVHLGQEDMPVADARRLLGDTAIIGLTVRSTAEAEAAPVELLDYVSIGGVFATRSKNNPNPPIGLAGLAAIVTVLRQRCTLPLCAIAGIEADTAATVWSTGIDGIAVISAITHAADPQQAAHELLTQSNPGSRS